MITYTGSRTGDRAIVLIIDESGRGTPLPLEPSLKVRNHSPTGFEWGYGGSGPTQLALAILLDHLQRTSPEGAIPEAERYYQMFKGDFVTGWDSRWKITGPEIDGWLRKIKAQAETKKKEYSYDHKFPKTTPT